MRVEVSKVLWSHFYSLWCCVVGQCQHSKELPASDLNMEVTSFFWKICVSHPGCMASHPRIVIVIYAVTVILSFPITLELALNIMQWSPDFIFLWEPHESGINCQNMWSLIYISFMGVWPRLYGKCINLCKMQNVRTWNWGFMVFVSMKHRHWRVGLLPG
jgi:hypothetical protein